MSPADYSTSQDLAYIYWDSNSQRFRDQSNGRVVSNITGIQTLSLGRPFGRPGYYDQFGHIAPSPSNLNYPNMDVTFVNTTRTLRSVSYDVYAQRAPTDSYYVTMATYTDDSGNLHLTHIYSKGGIPISFEDEQRRLARAIAHDLNIPLGAEGTKGVLERATHLFHFAAK